MAAESVDQRETGQRGAAEVIHVLSSRTASSDSIASHPLAYQSDQRRTGIQQSVMRRDMEAARTLKRVRSIDQTGGVIRRLRVPREMNQGGEVDADASVGEERLRRCG